VGQTAPAVPSPLRRSSEEWRWEPGSKSQLIGLPPFRLPGTNRGEMLEFAEGKPGTRAGRLSCALFDRDGHVGVRRHPEVQLEVKQAGGREVGFSSGREYMNPVLPWLHSREGEALAREVIAEID